MRLLLDAQTCNFNAFCGFSEIYAMSKFQLRQGSFTSYMSIRSSDEDRSDGDAGYWEDQRMQSIHADLWRYSKAETRRA